jgi:hypothetical protein
MSLASILGQSKDRLIESVVKLWLNRTLKPYGHMTHLRIDSKNKRIDIELDLKGETAPIHIAVNSYTLTSEGTETHIELGDIETSREWINALLDNFFKPASRRFSVPAAVKLLL